MKPIFAITMGDPCGVGPEITIKTLTNHPELYAQCRPIVIGSLDILKKTATKINMDVKIEALRGEDFTGTTVNRIHCLDINPVKFEHHYGQISAEGGKHSFAYLEKAIALAMEKKIAAIVTAPINKKSLKAGAVPYIDHTEILTKLTDSRRTMTLFVTGDLRVFFYSRHIPFKDISATLNIDNLVRNLSDCDSYLKQIRIMDPKIAVAALNPHGGEMGLFGTEEMEVITPAVERARKLGIDAVGPIPADSVFHMANQGHYDAVLSLYHDQGHIAAKTLDFHKTVALTMGLPFLRTSVDHGTAFDIAGKNIASEVSLVEAIKSAIKYAW